MSEKNIYCPKCGNRVGYNPAKDEYFCPWCKKVVQPTITMLTIPAERVKAVREKIRTFKSGATRTGDTDKLDYEAFLSPLVLERYAEYLHKHRKQADGTIRPGDNWQKGIPLSEYAKSGWRHFMDWWKEHRGLASRDGIEDALCGLIFNAMGYLHELLKAKLQRKSEQ